MNALYNVSLINLAADARAVAADALGPVERRGLTGAELRNLLQSFGEIDAVENAVVAPEIRVNAGNESYLVRTGQKKFMLYDVGHRELPALVLTLDEIMAELDGSAPAARNAASAPRHTATETGEPALALPVHPVAAASRPRLIILGIAAAALTAALIYSHPAKGPAAPGQFRPVGSAEFTGLQASLTGVYLTGNQPGDHGIVFMTVGEVKLFELTAREAPRIVHATGELGRIGSQLVLATDQPGGPIEITDRDTLVYGGEVYRRIP